MREASNRRAAKAAVILIMVSHCVSLLYSHPGTFAVRGGVGTDLNLGFGVGVGAAYIWNAAGSGPSYEFGADFYYHHSTDSYTDQRGNVTVTGEDKTTLTVFGVRANALFNYNPSRKSVYFIAGVGFVVANLQWEETESAPNWNAPYHDEVDGTSAGTIINIGIGVPLTTKLDVRLETPMLIFFSAAGNSATFAPTATIGLTYRFN